MAYKLHSLSNLSQYTDIYKKYHTTNVHNFDFSPWVACRWNFQTRLLIYK